MTLEDVRAYVNRDWEAIEAMKTRSWLDMKKRMSTTELFAHVDSLRAHVRSVHPDWPWESVRREDFEHHVRLSRLLRSV